MIEKQDIKGECGIQEHQTSYTIFTKYLLKYGSKDLNLSASTLDKDGASLCKLNSMQLNRDTQIIAHYLAQGQIGWHCYVYYQKRSTFLSFT